MLRAEAEQTSAEWMRGEDANGLAKHTPNPNSPWPTRQAKGASSTPANGQSSSPSPGPVGSSEPSTGTGAVASPAAALAPTATTRAPEQAPAGEPGPTSARSETQSEISSRSTAETTPPREQLAGLRLEATTATPEPAAKPAVSPAPSAAATSAAPATNTARFFSSKSSSPQHSAPAPTTRSDGLFNPKWSRNFLAGKTPLKPDYFDVHDVSSTMGNDVQLLQVSSPKKSRHWSSLALLTLSGD